MFERVRHAPGAIGRARSLRRRMTYTEQKLWGELRKLGLNVRRQAPIGRYVVDFAIHSKRLVIEVDGGVHERLRNVAARDAERQAWLEGEGYTVLRFTDRQVDANAVGCVAAVQQHLALLLDGGGLGGGEGAAIPPERGRTPAPKGVQNVDAKASPPSPTLPPSRRKGGVDLTAPSLDGEAS